MSEPPWWCKLTLPINQGKLGPTGDRLRDSHYLLLLCRDIQVEALAQVTVSNHLVSVSVSSSTARPEPLAMRRIDFPVPVLGIALMVYLSPAAQHARSMQWTACAASQPLRPDDPRFRMPPGQMIGGVMHGLVQCAKVFVATSSDKGAGAFAARDMSEGEVVERGIVRRLPATFDGNASPYVFSWSEDVVLLSRLFLKLVRVPDLIEYVLH